MKRILALTFIISFTSAFHVNADALVVPKDKKGIKAFYSEIDKEAKKLGAGEDEKVIANVIGSCLKARSLEPNLFCLDSLLEYYIKNTDKVQKVAKETLSKDDSEFVINRLNTLKSEALEGNDPSVY